MLTHGRRPPLRAPKRTHPQQRVFSPDHLWRVAAWLAHGTHALRVPPGTRKPRGCACTARAQSAIAAAAPVSLPRSLLVPSCEGAQAVRTRHSASFCAFAWRPRGPLSFPLLPSRLHSLHARAVMSTSMVPPSSSRVRVLPSASGRVAQVARAYSQNGATPPSSIPVAAVDAKAAVAVSKPKPVPRITLFRAMSFNGPAPGAPSAQCC